MTVMHIPPRGDLGAELHPNTDQYLRVEAGQALVRMGDCPESADIQRRLNTGDAVLIPGGTWHNIINIGNCPLKLSSLYAPPQHSRGTVHCTQADAAHEDH